MGVVTDNNPNGLPNGANQNGVMGDFGNINLMQGLDTYIEMCFYAHGTTDLATLNKFYLSFYDFDVGVGDVGETEPKNERLTLTQYSAYKVETSDFGNDNDPTLCKVREFAFFDGALQTDYPIYAAPDEFIDGAPTGYDWTTESQYAMCERESETGGGIGTTLYEVYPCTEIEVQDLCNDNDPTLCGATNGGSTSFTSSVRGWGCDNPEEVQFWGMTDVQKARLVVFEFLDRSCIDIEYDVGGDLKEDSGRNFLFAGGAQDCECDAPTDLCAPPSAPP